MATPAYRKPARLPAELQARFRLTTAMLDLWSCPTSARLVRYAAYELLARERAGQPDALGLRSEAAYFATFRSE